jgi:hypothetical protein
LPAGEAGGRCPACGASLRGQQRYCLDCGERVVSKDARLDELLQRARRRADAPAAAAAAPPPEPPASGGGASPDRRVRPLAAVLAGLAELRLPSPRVSALLVLVFAGFGVLLGSVASSQTGYSLAASQRPKLKLVLPATHTASGSETTSTASEPPPASAEPTPASTAAPSTASTPAPASAPASSAPATGGGGSGGKQGAAPPAGAPGTKLPPIKHVFVIMLSDQPYAAVFGPSSAATYLSRTLEPRGALLARYYAVAHEQLADGIALLSGQGPTPATAANCPQYTALTPATVGDEEQVTGEGCVYPPTTATLPGQLEVKHLTWRAYVQGIDEAGSAAPACAHPALGAPDPSSSQSSTQPYATFRNPFVYFQGLSESPSCAADDVGLSQLDADLSDAKRTPNLSYIVPDRCHDGSPGPCPGGGAGGLPAADGLLAQIVPKILASPAFKREGLLVITVDEAPSSGEFADSSSCCGQPRFPNLPPPTGVAASLPEGGGQVGALLLSPFVKAHATSQEPYNHFSLLRTIEDLFDLKHLGYAGGAQVSSLEPSLFQAKPAG